MTRERVTREEASEELGKRAEGVTMNDFNEVLSKQHKIENLFQSNGPLKKFISEVKILFSLVKDYYNGVYREIPWWSISAVVAALIYVISPIDLIPDFIPVIGFIDDAAVVAVCLSLIRNDLENYVQWKNTQGVN